MSVILATAVKTAVLTAIRDQVAAGSLEILDASNVLLAAFTLSGSGGSVAGAVWTLTFASSTVASGAAGTAAKAQIKNSGGTALITGLTVGTTAADIILTSTTIASGQNVILTSATITHP
ncbi:hypothetical protein [Mesorhizobium japonicum]|uniref:Mll0461 protein n=1 Tax=Mesorhizobium japonicum (strain LMG 29417 / CECT 9101 / MAFF 303099) TaxID=266835 RepID=Q98MS3_RHILO|nr:hypothetical protein [Mesorhizobium japonicum]BAB48040.1 mll0461 [Mesorhizobium japonicum MAFF 303099]